MNDGVIHLHSTKKKQCGSNLFHGANKNGPDYWRFLAVYEAHSRNPDGVQKAVNGTLSS